MPRSRADVAQMGQRSRLTTEPGSGIEARSPGDETGHFVERPDRRHTHGVMHDARIPRLWMHTPKPAPGRLPHDTASQAARLIVVRAGRHRRCCANLVSPRYGARGHLAHGRRPRSWLARRGLAANRANMFRAWTWTKHVAGASRAGPLSPSVPRASYRIAALLVRMPRPAGAGSAGSANRSSSWHRSPASRGQGLPTGNRYVLAGFRHLMGERASTPAPRHARDPLTERGGGAARVVCAAPATRTHGAGSRLWRSRRQASVTTRLPGHPGESSMRVSRRKGPEGGRRPGGRAGHGRRRPGRRCPRVGGRR
ncbi:hypothetical protein SAVIM40S_03804 [Streptomyces avidinii]